MKTKDYFIVDNFLSEHDHNQIVENTYKNTYFPLFLKEGVSHFKKSRDGFFLTHIFYLDDEVKSPFINLLHPIIDIIKPEKLIRIQLNLYPKTFFRRKHGCHIDYDIPHKGVLYYLNNNNGKTILHDKTKISSLKNRALFFDPSKKHRSTTCTDTDFRSNIIFNYL